MKRLIKLLVNVLALTFLTASCNDFTSESGISGIVPKASEPHVFTATELFPSGDAELFVLYPMSGWTLHYGETILFQALLLDQETGLYIDVTYDTKCQFDFSCGSGIAVNGSCPSLENGQEIVVRATYNHQTYAESIGHFIIDSDTDRRHEK